MERRPYKPNRPNFGKKELISIQNSNNRRFPDTSAWTFEPRFLSASPRSWKELDDFQKIESVLCAVALAASLAPLATGIIPQTSEGNDQGESAIPRLISSFYQSIDPHVRPSDSGVVKSIRNEVGISANGGLSELAAEENNQSVDGLAMQVMRLALRSAGIVETNKGLFIHEVGANGNVCKRSISAFEAMQKIAAEGLLVLSDMSKNQITGSMIASMLGFAGDTSSFAAQENNSSQCKVPVEASSQGQGLSDEQIKASLVQATTVEDAYKQMQNGTPPAFNTKKDGEYAFAGIVTLTADQAKAQETAKIVAFYEKQLTPQGFQLIKSNGEDAIFYNSKGDIFMKFNLQGNHGRTVLEYEQMSAGVREAFPKQNVRSWVNLIKIKGPNNEEIPVTMSRYLGITFEKAVNEGLIKKGELPTFIRATLDTVENMARKTGRFNKDLNPRNVLVGLDPDSGKFRIIIIDWGSSMRVEAGKIPFESFVPSFRKFFSSSTLYLSKKEKEVALSSVTEWMRTMGRRELADMIETSMTKEGLKLLLKQTGTKEGIVRMIKIGGKGTLIALTLAGLVLSYEDVKAATIEDDQRGENFHIDLSGMYISKNAIDERGCIENALDAIGGMPDEDGFQFIKTIGIDGKTMEKWREVMKTEPTDKMHMLIMKNFINQGGPYTGNPNEDYEIIYTGILVGHDASGKVVFTDEAGKRISNGSEIILTTVRHKGYLDKPSVDIYRAQFLTDVTGRNNKSWEFAIQKQSLISSTPINEP